MTDQLQKLQRENNVLRGKLEAIQTFAESWRDQYTPIGRGSTSIENVRGNLAIIDAMADVPQLENSVAMAALTHVWHGCDVYSGNIINENPDEDNPDHVEIEVYSTDPTAGRMSIVGPIVQ